MPVDGAGWHKVPSEFAHDDDDDADVELMMMTDGGLFLLATLDDDYDSSCDQDSCTTSDSENDPLSGVLSYLGRPTTSKKKFQQGECQVRAARVVSRMW